MPTSNQAIESALQHLSESLFNLTISQPGTEAGSSAGAELCGNGSQHPHQSTGTPWGVKASQGARPNMEDAYSVQLQQFIPENLTVANDSQHAGANHTAPTGQVVSLPKDAAKDEACKPAVPAVIPEDLAVLSVFDGHGGTDVAEHCRDRLHRHFATCLSLHHSQSLPSEDSENSLSPAAAGGTHNEASENPRLRHSLSDTSAGCTMSTGASAGVPRAYAPEHVEVALREAFARTDEELAGTEAGDYVGATAVVAVIGRKHIWVAHCGDSRAVIQRGGEPEALTRDHKPDRDDEAARIRAAGGRIVMSSGTHRVMGMLAMSRAIGDHFLRPYVIAEPEIAVVERTHQDEVLVLATDGLWDVFTCKEATALAQRCITRSKDRGMSRHGACRVAASVLTKVALERGSRDNITVIVVDVSMHQARTTQQSVPVPMTSTAQTSGLVSQITDMTATSPPGSMRPSGTGEMQMASPDREPCAHSVAPSNTVTHGGQPVSPIKHTNASAQSKPAAAAASPQQEANAKPGEASSQTQPTQTNLNVAEGLGQPSSKDASATPASAAQHQQQQATQSKPPTQSGPTGTSTHSTGGNTQQSSSAVASGGQAVTSYPSSAAAGSNGSVAGNTSATSSAACSSAASTGSRKSTSASAPSIGPMMSVPVQGVASGSAKEGNTKSLVSSAIPSGGSLKEGVRGMGAKTQSFSVSSCTLVKSNAIGTASVHANINAASKQELEGSIGAGRGMGRQHSAPQAPVQGTEPVGQRPSAPTIGSTLPVSSVGSSGSTLATSSISTPPQIPAHQQQQQASSSLYSSTGSVSSAAVSSIPGDGSKPALAPTPSSAHSGLSGISAYGSAPNLPLLGAASSNSSPVVNNTSGSAGGGRPSVGSVSMGHSSTAQPFSMAGYLQAHIDGSQASPGSPKSPALRSLLSEHSSGSHDVLDKGISPDAASGKIAVAYGPAAGAPAATGKAVAAVAASQSGGGARTSSDHGGSSRQRPRVSVRRTSATNTLTHTSSFSTGSSGSATSAAAAKATALTSQHCDEDDLPAAGDCITTDVVTTPKEEDADVIVCGTSTSQRQTSDNMQRRASASMQ